MFESYKRLIFTGIMYFEKSNAQDSDAPGDFGHGTRLNEVFQEYNKSDGKVDSDELNDLTDIFEAEIGNIDDNSSITNATKDGLSSMMQELRKAATRKVPEGMNLLSAVESTSDRQPQGDGKETKNELTISVKHDWVKQNLSVDEIGFDYENPTQADALKLLSNFQNTRFSGMGPESSAQAIYALQVILESAGHSVSGIDGVYGDNTEKALQQYQQDVLGFKKDSRRVFTKADGIPGPGTIKAILEKNDVKSEKIVKQQPAAPKAKIVEQQVTTPNTDVEVLRAQVAELEEQIKASSKDSEPLRERIKILQGQLDDLERVMAISNESNIQDNKPKEVNDTDEIQALKSEITSLDIELKAIQDELKEMTNGDVKLIKVESSIDKKTSKGDLKKILSNIKAAIDATKTQKEEFEKRASDALEAEIKRKAKELLEQQNEAAAGELKASQEAIEQAELSQLQGDIKSYLAKKTGAIKPYLDGTSEALKTQLGYAAVTLNSSTTREAFDTNTTEYDEIFNQITTEAQTKKQTIPAAQPKVQPTKRVMANGEIKIEKNKSTDVNDVTYYRAKQNNIVFLINDAGDQLLAEHDLVYLRPDVTKKVGDVTYYKAKSGGDTFYISVDGDKKKVSEFDK